MIIIFLLYFKIIQLKKLFITHYKTSNLYIFVFRYHRIYLLFYLLRGMCKIRLILTIFTNKEIK